MRKRDLRERLLTVQIEMLLAEQARLDRRRAEIKAHEQELEQRLAELARREADHREGAAHIAAKLERRSEELDKREAELDRRAKALDETVRQKARAHAEETVLSKGEVTVAVVAPMKPPAVEARPDENGWNLNQLEGLVEQSAAAFPGRIDEWRYYLLYLREFANVNGVLPRSFDWLVGEAFGDLLGVEAERAQPQAATAL
jgi:hypothetical protein